MDSTIFTQPLIIDPEFKNLLIPLSSKEYKQLEENIQTQGCLDPIITWNGIIIDGHNRYAICQKYHIPFRTRTVAFKYREEVIAWMCANQLKKHNLPEETQKYLIGKKYETEKIIGTRNASEINQHILNSVSNTLTEKKNRKVTAIPSHNQTIHDIGCAYNISHNTVYKYGIYSKAMDAIHEKCPEIAHKILSSKIKVSHDNLINLSRLSKMELQSLLDCLIMDTEGHIRYSDIRHELQWKPVQKNIKKGSPIPQKELPIKQLPKFDPDAEISSLTLTIPSWISSMTRAKSNTNFDNTSSLARSKLSLQLENLQIAIDEILVHIKEELQ